MTNRICSSCKKTLPIENFSFKSKAKMIYSSSCKSCQKVWKDNHYKNNKQKYLERNRRDRKDRLEWWREYKSKLKCEVCDENHPATLDFHHKDPTQKEFTISCFINWYSKEKLLVEIEKCSVLCSNCHRKLHWEE